MYMYRERRASWKMYRHEGETVEEVLNVVEWVLFIRLIIPRFRLIYLIMTRTLLC